MIKVIIKGVALTIKHKPLVIVTTQNSANNQSQQKNHNRWVINLSKTPLAKGQESLLAKGPNFAIAPNNIHNVDYIAAVESMCHRLKEEDQGALRANINSLL